MRPHASLSLTARQGLRAFINAMKPLLIFLFTLTVSFTAKAQILLGKSESYVIQNFSKRTDSLTFVGKGINPEGLSYVAYSTSDNIVLSYFFKKQVCVLYMVIYPISYLPKIAKDMNAAHIHVSDAVWTSKDMTYKIEITYPDELKTAFCLRFTIL